MVTELNPSDLVETAIKPAAQDAGDDVLNVIDSILSKADGLISKVAAAKGLNLGGSGSAVQANGLPSGGGIGLPEIKQALHYVKQFKGDITISELLKLMDENGSLIEGVLGGKK